MEEIKKEAKFRKFKKEVRFWNNILLIMFAIGFIDGAFYLGIPDWVYTLTGLTIIVVIYKLYKVSK